jgi:hypothetical protein
MHAWVVTAGHSLTGLDHMACLPYSIQRISCSFAQSGRPKFLLKNHSLSAVYATVNEVRALITMKHQCHCFYCSFRACVVSTSIFSSAGIFGSPSPLLVHPFPCIYHFFCYTVFDWLIDMISQGKKEKKKRKEELV